MTSNFYHSTKAPKLQYSLMQISDGYSQGSHIVFIAETLAFTWLAPTACFINHLGEELSLIPTTSQITTYTDNKSLHDSTNNTSQILDPRLCVEMSAIREMKEREEIRGAFYRFL